MSLTGQTTRRTSKATAVSIVGSIRTVGQAFSSEVDKTSVTRDATVRAALALITFVVAGQAFAVDVESAFRTFLSTGASEVVEPFNTTNADVRADAVRTLFWAGLALRSCIVSSIGTVNNADFVLFIPDEVFSALSAICAIGTEDTVVDALATHIIS